jgi:hypothetical protein
MKRTIIGAVVTLLLGTIINWWAFSIHSSADWNPDWLPFVASLPGLFFGATIVEATGAKEALIPSILYSSVALQWVLPGAVIGYVIHRLHRRKLLAQPASERRDF